MKRQLPMTLLVPIVAGLVAACSSGGSTPSPAATPAPTGTVAITAPATATPDACAVTSLKTLASGKLTVGTDNPAYPPYFEPPDNGKYLSPWKDQGDPSSGKGFESAVAYAVAGKMGFTKDQVAWTAVSFDNSYAPGAKPFDIYLGQVSFTAQRAQAVDMSDGYYNVAQSIVAIKDSPIAKAKSVADLKQFRFGAQQGTTAYATIQTVIAPSAKPSVYNTNDAAIQALKAKQIDGIVVDLPTALFITAAQMDNGVVVGQFPAATGADAEHFSLVLQKGSSLTTCVNKAIAALKSDGTLDTITKEWMSDKASVPIFSR